MVTVMECIADLCTHSSASDGQYTPCELVQRVKDKEIEILSITDHDTVDGLNAAEKAAIASGIILIQGGSWVRWSTEISTFWDIIFRRMRPT